MVLIFLYIFFLIATYNPDLIRFNNSDIEYSHKKIQTLKIEPSNISDEITCLECENPSSDFTKLEIDSSLTSPDYHLHSSPEDLEGNQMMEFQNQELELNWLQIKKLFSLLEQEKQKKELKQRWTNKFAFADKEQKKMLHTGLYHANREKHTSKSRNLLINEENSHTSDQGTTQSRKSRRKASYEINHKTKQKKKA